jgi:hypothetical protein
MWLSENALASQSISSPRLQKSLSCLKDDDDVISNVEHERILHWNKNPKSQNFENQQQQTSPSDVNRVETKPKPINNINRIEKADKSLGQSVENDDCDIYKIDGGVDERAFLRISASEE